MERYVAFLRGINVGGHHKVPMADLRKIFEELNFHDIVTVLNSGNIVFNAPKQDMKDLANMISRKLEESFGFPVPTIVRKSETIIQLFDTLPFRDVKINKDIRLYVSFLNNISPSDLELPWISDDTSFKIIEYKDRAVFSILDLSVAKTPEAMNIMEKSFGKDITTRNWNTIERIVNKL